MASVVSAKELRMILDEVMTEIDADHWRRSKSHEAFEALAIAIRGSRLGSPMRVSES